MFFSLQHGGRYPSFFSFLACTIFHIPLPIKNTPITIKYGVNFIRELFVANSPVELPIPISTHGPQQHDVASMMPNALDIMPFLFSVVESNVIKINERVGFKEIRKTVF